MAGAGVAAAPVVVLVPPVPVPALAPVDPVAAVVPVDPVDPVAPVADGVAVAVADAVGVGVAVPEAATPFWCGTLSAAGGPGTSGTAPESEPQPGAESASPAMASSVVERRRRKRARDLSGGGRPSGGRTRGSR